MSSICKKSYIYFFVFIISNPFNKLIYKRISDQIAFQIFKRIFIFSGDDKIIYYQESFDHYEQHFNSCRNTQKESIFNLACHIRS